MIMIMPDDANLDYNNARMMLTIMIPTAMMIIIPGH